MAVGPRFVVRFRRRRSGRTDYKNRIALIRSELPRLAVRISNKLVNAQIIQYATSGDKTLLTVNSNQLSKLGWSHGGKNVPAAYLTGLLIGKFAVDKGVKQAVFDIGMKPSTKGGRIYAALKGALDAGLQIPHGTANFPSEDRLKGKHINEGFAKDFDAAKANILKAEAVKKTQPKAKARKLTELASEASFQLHKKSVPDDPTFYTAEKSEKKVKKQ